MNFCMLYVKASKVRSVQHEQDPALSAARARVHAGPGTFPKLTGLRPVGLLYADNMNWIMPMLCL